MLLFKVEQSGAAIMTLEISAPFRISSFAERQKSNGLVFGSFS
jgi:hypothetical protein